MTLAGKTVLVTGATGFVGGALARRFAGEGAHVKAIVRSPEKAAYIRDNPRIELVQGDILDPAGLKNIVQGSDFVFHCAAALGAGDYVHQYQVNVEGTRNVLEAAVSAKVQRVVHISTIAVYGYRHTGHIDENTPASITHNPYSLTKAQAENLVREVMKSHDLSYTILRPGMIYGPRSRAWTKRMFRLATRKSLLFLGGGHGTMPLIYIDDLVDLCVLTVTHPNAHNETFNVVMNPAPTWREYLGYYAEVVGGRQWIGLPVLPARWIIQLAALFSGKHASIRDIPAMISLFSRRFQYDMRKTQEKLDWQPRTDLLTGVQASLEWLREEKLLD